MNSLSVTGQVVRALEELNVPYVLVGALSVNFYGISRARKDADFVINPAKGDLSRLVAKLGPDFRLNRQMQAHVTTLTNLYRAYGRLEQRRPAVGTAPTRQTANNTVFAPVSPLPFLRDQNKMVQHGLRR